MNSGDDVVDLDGLFHQKDFAYALAEIKATRPSTAILAVGSDDGIRIWQMGTWYMITGYHTWRCQRQ